MQQMQFYLLQFHHMEKEEAWWALLLRSSVRRQFYTWSLQGWNMLQILEPSWSGTRNFKVILPSKDLPPFLQQHPEICMTIKQYAKENLANLCMEFVSNSIHNMILPLMVTEAVKEAAEAMTHNRELKKLLKRYHPSSISLVTIYCWMIHLGFKCKPRKKGYYVNDNEKPAMISYRCHFVSNTWDTSSACTIGHRFPKTKQRC